MLFKELLLQPFVWLSLLPFLLLLIIQIVSNFIRNKEYKNSAYYQITKLPYSYVENDLGVYGEYLTYKYLKDFETNGAKFLLIFISLRKMVKQQRLMF